MITPAKKFLFSISALILVAFLFSGYVWASFYRQKILQVVFLDVGQGDSVLIRTPDNQNILIDGGPDSTVLYKIGKYLPFYNRTIDLMILTHPHSDHVAGLVRVLKRYKVKKILSTGVAHTSADYLKWLELIRGKNIEFIKVSDSEKFKFVTGQTDGDNMILKVLYPFSDISQKKFEDLNTSSVIVKLIYGENSFLFTGDLPAEKEEELISANIDIKADVLKVGHHGSRDSSSVEFLKKVQPGYAVIQSGRDNKFGHPHRRVIRNLKKNGIKILRTDEEGDIVFSSNGQQLFLSN